MKFRYEKYGSKEGEIFYPSLNIEIVNPKTKKISPSYKVLVDSGASSCIFHAWLGERIGIEIDKGEKKQFVGVTDKAGVQYIHPVTMIMGGNEVNLSAGFSHDLKSWFGLLGQKGFFEKHRICFDLPVGDFTITPKS